MKYLCNSIPLRSGSGAVLQPGPVWYFFLSRYTHEVFIFQMCTMKLVSAGDSGGGNPSFVVERKVVLPVAFAFGFFFLLGKSHMPDDITLLSIN